MISQTVCLDVTIRHLCNARGVWMSPSLLSATSKYFNVKINEVGSHVSTCLHAKPWPRNNGHGNNFQTPTPLLQQKIGICSCIQTNNRTHHFLLPSSHLQWGINSMLLEIFLITININLYIHILHVMISIHSVLGIIAKN